MAWNIETIENNIKGLDKHLYTWLNREFGEEYAKELLTVMNEYYRLAYIRKPEFMGGTRTEEKDPKYKIVADLPWSQEQIIQRLEEYNRISDKVTELSKTISPDKYDTWFQLIEYPVRGAAEMNKKHLYAQLARHGITDWAKSDVAHQTIIEFTRKYNSLSDGKWKNMMDYQPRNLPVFQQIPHTKAETPMAEYQPPLFLFNGKEYNEFKGDKPIEHGLGYQRGAVSLTPKSAVTYYFTSEVLDSIQVKVALAPNHPVNSKVIRYSIQVDKEPTTAVEFQTKGRSEEWKENVLRNQAIRVTKHTLPNKGRHKITVTALDEGVIVDQISILKI